MISIYNTQEEVDEVAEPKFVWIDINRFIVYTGDDIPLPPVAEITVEELRGRFTMLEMMDFLSFARTDDTANLLLFKLQTRSTPIQKDDPSLVGGLDYLVASGKLEAVRVAVILA